MCPSNGTVTRTVQVAIGRAVGSQGGPRLQLLTSSCNQRGDREAIPAQSRAVRSSGLQPGVGDSLGGSWCSEPLLSSKVMDRDPSIIQ